MESKLHHREFEESILGTFMLFSASGEAKEFVSTLDPEIFYFPDTKAVFIAIRELHNENLSFDLPSVTNRLWEKDVIDRIGGARQLMAMTTKISSSEVLPQQIEVLNKLLIRRKLWQLSFTLRHASEDLSKPILESLSELERKMGEMNNSINLAHTYGYSFREVIDRGLHQIQERSSGDTNSLPVEPTPWNSLNTKIQGFPKSALTIVGARPGMGKTSFACQCLLHLASHGKPVGLVSLEMTYGALADRFISNICEIDNADIRSGAISKEDTMRMHDVLGRVYDLPVFVNDVASLKSFELRAIIRRWHAEHDLSAIVVDYLQLVNPDESSDNKNIEIERITFSLRILAKELGIPIILLCQLSRAVERRPDKRPMNSDLRDSGSIEQEAELIMFLYRDSYYDNMEQVGGTELDECEVIITKNRNGPCCTSYLGFKGAFTKFYEKDAWAKNGWD